MRNRAPRRSFRRRRSRRRLASSKAEVLPSFPQPHKTRSTGPVWAGSVARSSPRLLGRLSAPLTTQPSGASRAACLPCYLSSNPTQLQAPALCFQLWWLTDVSTFCACDLTASLGKVIALDIDAMLFTPPWSVKLTSCRPRQWGWMLCMCTCYVCVCMRERARVCMIHWW